ncbi:MAG: IS91 family transposase, partial [Clostridiaceae bacterium]|nr:IS91 family transposase [Clostridiaceae bacterium]
MNILQEIFNDNFEQMLYLLKPRKTVVENVEKMIHCGDPLYGGAMYGCSDCG